MRARPRKRPCRICGKWFEPDPRVGDRQRTCGRPECQRKWHRKTDAAWRRRNPDYDREGRFRERLLGVSEEQEAGSGTARAAREGGLLWSVAQEEIGLEAAIVIEESCIQVIDRVQEELRRYLPGTKDDSRQQPLRSAQEEIGRSGRPP